MEIKRGKWNVREGVEGLQNGFGMTISNTFTPEIFYDQVMSASAGTVFLIGEDPFRFF